MKKIPALLFAFTIGLAKADVPVEPIGLTETLEIPYLNSWFWATDPLLRRISLTDAGNDRSLGTIDGGQMLSVPLFPQKHTQEFYLPETHYSRGSRGERTDIVTVYETNTLRPIGEILIPPKRAMNGLPIGNAALSDDEQFLAIFNMTPATSLSIIDIHRRTFVEEIETPGCSLVYGAGTRRFMMLCGDGSLLFIKLKPDGTLLRQSGSEKVFDPQADPLTEKAVRFKNFWLFVSFEGFIYPINYLTENPASLSMQSVAPWSLLNNQEREQNWRIGGRQLIAVDENSKRLYTLFHQGEKDTHKQGGTHLWVHDLTSHKKIDAIKLHSPGITFSGVGTEFGSDWVWPFNQTYNFLTDFSLMEPHARPDSIVVTREEHPRLLVSGQFTGMVAVYDATTLSLQHRVTTGNISNLGLFLPDWGKLPNHKSSPTP
jgi:methylamine dehydrogenase heavy chain